MDTVGTQGAGRRPSVSVVTPCLNEAETLAVCIEKSKRSFAANQIDGEVIVADNRSEDGSPDIARRCGARVVDVAQRGYGRALIAGIAAAKGEFVIMGDADDSYDFSNITPFLEKLDEGYDLVMGNRFKGGIMPGAMPWKHRWIGNPVLSGIGRLWFGAPVGDFHCGLRAFRKSSIEKLGLLTTGMEFASEMVIKSTLMGLKISEVPVTLYKDGRSRPPHLRSWRDGWRHLRFMLLFSPRWLFLIPGILFFLAGLALSLFVIKGPVLVGHLGLDIHTLLISGFLCIVSYQLIIFALLTKRFSLIHGLHPSHAAYSRLEKLVTLEIGVLVWLLMTLAGLALFAEVCRGWYASGFGALDPGPTMRRLIPAAVLATLGTQTVFSSFFLSILAIPRKQRA